MQKKKNLVSCSFHTCRVLRIIQENHATVFLLRTKKRFISYAFNLHTRLLVCKQVHFHSFHSLQRNWLCHDLTIRPGRRQQVDSTSANFEHFQTKMVTVAYDKIYIDNIPGDGDQASENCSIILETDYLILWVQLVTASMKDSWE